MTAHTTTTTTATTATSTTSFSSSSLSSLEDKLKPIALLGNYNAAQVWVTIDFVFLGWALLILAPRWKYTRYITLLPPLFHSFVYVASFISFIFLSPQNNNNDNDDNNTDIDMMSFQGVVDMFQDPNIVFVGWIHYIAFDLLVARMVVLESVELGASTLFHVIGMVPTILLTLFLGPFGWLLYMVIMKPILLLSASSSSSSSGQKSETKKKQS